MTEGPKTPIESTEKPAEKISREKLISFAKERPPQDPEVRDMLIRWLDETRVQQETEKQYEGWEYADIAIMQAVMKYRLGFLSKDDAIEELEQIGIGLVTAQDLKRQSIYDRLLALLEKIKTNRFEIIRHA